MSPMTKYWSSPRMQPRLWGTHRIEPGPVSSRQVGLIEAHPVDTYCALRYLHRFTWQPDDPLDQVTPRLIGVLEYDHIAAPGWTCERQVPFVACFDIPEGYEPGEAPHINTQICHLVHNDVLAILQGRVHAISPDLNRLDAELHNEETRDSQGNGC